MNNTKVLEEFFIWEENNSTEPKMKSENKTESEPNDSMINTKTVNEYENWKTITDPKERQKAYKKAWYESNKDKVKSDKKKHYELNKDKVKKYQKQYGKNYYKQNKEERLIKQKAYYNANRLLCLEKKKEYRLKNKEKCHSATKKWKVKNKNNLNYLLPRRLRDRLYKAINNNQKSGSAVRDLGCTIAELKVYLQSKFQPGMSWDNWALDGWHIDHIKPLSSFDLTDRNQFLEACHYTNLQPLWAQDNLSKSDKILSN